MFAIESLIAPSIAISMLSSMQLLIICDWACENRAYLHTKFGLTFELQLTISFEVQAP